MDAAGVRMWANQQDALSLTGGQLYTEQMQARKMDEEEKEGGQDRTDVSWKSVKINTIQ